MTATAVAELPSVSDENPRTQLADQWWQWAARNPKGGVTVAYNDRKYGDAQQTGFMDITMRRGNGSHVRVTNRSLPATQEFPEAGASTGVFVGDYMGLVVGADGRAHPIWTDTRNPVFSPSTGGRARARQGRAGHRHLHPQPARVAQGGLLARRRQAR